MRAAGPRKGNVMTKRTGSSVLAAAALVALGIATAAGAEVPGPDRIEVVQTADGPRALLAGVGRGTPFGEAAERLGGVGVVDAFFGGQGPIFHGGEIDGLRCGIMVVAGDASRGEAEVVQDIVLECDGGRLALWRLARRYRAALASLPERDGWYGTYPFGATVRIVPAKEGAWWEELFGPQVLRVTIR